MEAKLKKEGESPEVTNSYSFVWIFVGILLLGIAICLIAIHNAHVPTITLSMGFLKDISGWIWTLFIVLILGGIIWKFYPSLKVFRNWIIGIALAILVIWGVLFAWHYYHKPPEEENFPNIPEITYGTAQHMAGGKWYKYHCFIDGVHTNLFVTPQNSTTYIESTKLGIEGVWGEVRINQDDIVDITKN